jgi:hypothetical protein
MPALKHRRSATRRRLPTWPVAICTPRGVVIEQRPVIRRPAPERISPAQDVAQAADLLDDDYREPVEQLLTSFEAEAGKILRAHGYPSDLDGLEWGPWQDRITQQATMGVLDIAPVEHALLPQSALRLLVLLPEARAALARGDAYRAIYYALHVALRSPELTILSFRVRLSYPPVCDVCRGLRDDQRTRPFTRSSDRHWSRRR